MEHNFPDLPTMPMPAAKPQKKRPKSWLLAALIVGVLLLVFGVSIVGILLHSSAPGSQARGATSTATAPQSGQPTNTAIATATSAQATSTSTSTSTAGVSHTPTPTPTPIIGAPLATHGRPHLAGPFSDFIGAYGAPTNQGDGSGENFWAGTSQSIDINVSRSDQGEVTQLNILGPLSWDAQQAQSYCAQFLPDNAVQYNATSTQIDYHSNSGNVVLTIQTQSCLLSLARS